MDKIIASAAHVPATTPSAVLPNLVVERLDADGGSSDTSFTFTNAAFTFTNAAFTFTNSSQQHTVGAQRTAGLSRA
ncbi:hypothetical protein AB0O76_01825 [Streptomyces sp. NPDC086554]|uniref:hypothetical protein n=1 Tax=Streptomyces sp. NPDC086554 TaxID=3154864 RepID=UPI00343B4059